MGGGRISGAVVEAVSLLAPCVAQFFKASVEFPILIDTERPKRLGDSYCSNCAVRTISVPQFGVGPNC